MEKQIIVMKAQHQFITNLQKANNQLKARLKVIEESSSDVINQSDILSKD